MVYGVCGVCALVYVRMCVCIYVCLSACMHACIRGRMYVCVCARANACARARCVRACECAGARQQSGVYVRMELFVMYTNTIDQPTYMHIQLVCDFVNIMEV